MPRLSIIIPYRRHDQRLEATLISVLENRPEDCEIIVAHDGSYTDPYELRDEVLFVEEEPRSTPVQLLNAGMLAACSPLVATILDGTTVREGWADGPLEWLEQTDNASVAVRTEGADQREPSCGVDGRLLDDLSTLHRGQIDASSPDTPVAGPTLVCGFYRKRVLLALGGWDQQLDLTVADIDLAWALQSLDLRCECYPEPMAWEEQSHHRRLSTTATKQLAELAVAYGIAQGGTASAMSELLRVCLSGSVSAAVAWASGIMSCRASQRVATRLQTAEEQLNKVEPADLRLFVGPETARLRAA